MKFISPETRRALRRGFLMRCAACGEGKLFRAFLKPVECCSHCGENWGEVRADDGPAWATMLIVGHLLAPFFHFFALSGAVPAWSGGLILSALAVVLSLLLLQPMKGVFMALIKKTGAPTS